MIYKSVSFETEVNIPGDKTHSHVRDLKRSSTSILEGAARPIGAQSAAGGKWCEAAEAFLRMISAGTLVADVSQLL